MGPTMTFDKKATRRSIVKYFDGDFYTRYLAKGYDRMTTLTGWRSQLARHAVSGIKPGKMLDVGCGTGFIMDIARSKGFDVFGAEPSDGMIQQAHLKYGFTEKNIVKSNADQLPFPDESFDFVIACGSMEYVPNIQEASADMYRVLKKGGVLRIIDHAPPKKKNLLTGFIYLYTHASGHLIHDYEFYFSQKGKMVQHKTLGRGGYMQLFDFKKG